MKTNYEIKKEAINVLTQEMISPFAVMNAINKNRKDPAIAELMQMYGITKKLDLSALLGLYDYSDKNVFCKLKKLTNKQSYTYCEYKQVKIRNTFYELVPIKFTIADFFASMDAKKKIDAENERIAKELEKLFAESEKQESKKKAAKAAKVTELAKKLQEQLPDLPYSKVLEIAGKMVA